MRPVIQTYAKGEAFDFIQPSVDMIDIETIAHSLSNMCRFSGHCEEFYSVALHSCYVANLVPDELKLAALLHDAHEAYWGFGDITAPAKATLPEAFQVHLKKRQYLVDGQVANKFGFSPGLFNHPTIKFADRTMLATEKRDCMKPSQFEWIQLPFPRKEEITMALSPKLAKSKFLGYFETFTK